MSRELKPFNNAEEVWLWFCNSINARSDGFRSRGNYPGVERNVEVSDVYRIVKRMRLNKQISNRTLRVMTQWGMTGSPPHHSRRAKPSEVKIWEYGIKVLDWYLRVKGIL